MSAVAGRVGEGMAGLLSAAAAEVLTVSVTEAAFVPGVTVAGEKVQVAFEGNPLQLRLTGFGKDPATGDTVSEYVAGLPALTVTASTDVDTAKSDTDADPVRLTVCEPV